MSGLMVKILFPIYHTSRDPVTRWLGSLHRTYQQCAFLQPSSRNNAPCTHQRKQIHMSCVRLKNVIGKKHVIQSKEHDKHSKVHEEWKKVSKNVKWAYLRPNMTVTEVAEKLCVPLDDVLESITVITNKKYSPDQRVESTIVLTKVGVALKRRFKIVIIPNDKTVTMVGALEEEEREKKFKIKKRRKPRKDSEIDNQRKPEEESEDIEKQSPPDPKKLVNRPPVVTVMGHVDHGKTTLLDALRESRVVDQEFGGITQHIGAFSVKLPSGHLITFLDTPGHAAFSAMRARGASVTDIIVLVIAVEDGVMPQTVDSIKLAQAANVPLVIAINKIDRYGETNVEVIKNLLTAHGVVVEDLGGESQVVPISALKRINLDKLEECITTLAEFLELKGDPDGLVEGRVIEARTEHGKGKIATVLVKRGTLKRGDLLISGTTWTRVRAMYDNNGAVVQKATLSMPVEIGGWKDLPEVGDEVLQAKNEKKLKKALEYRLNQKASLEETEALEIIQGKRIEERELYVKQRKSKLNTKGVLSLRLTSISQVERVIGQSLIPLEEENNKPKFHIVIKGDVAGSVEAILNTLASFKSDLCDLDIMHSGTGEVTQFDIDLAESFEGEVYAFNVGVAANTNTDVVKKHNVIYNLFNDLIESISNRLPSTTKEEIIGEATIQQMYSVSDNKNKNKKIDIAGCKCVSGKLERSQLYKVTRNDEVIFDGVLDSLKHFKDEVTEIKRDQECGICFRSGNPITFQAGDTVICYKKTVVKQFLDWEPAFSNTEEINTYQNIT